MNNLFVTNPIKINILSCTGNNDIYIEKLIVFIGKVPKNVKTELSNLEKYISKQYKKITNHDDLKLEKKIKNKFPNIKKFYGINWINRLGIDNIFLGKDIKGGQKDHLDEDIDFDFDSPIETDIDLDDLLQPALVSSPIDDNVDISVPEGTTDTFIIEPFTDLLGIDEDKAEEILESNIETIFKDREYKQIQYLLGKTKIQWVFEECKIFPFDKIEEFKLKIFSITNILPYAQHLWFTHKKQSYALSYNIIKNNVPIYFTCR